MARPRIQVKKEHGRARGQSRTRPGFAYLGVELPEVDLEIVRRLAKDDDRSIGSLFRIIVADWIRKDAKASLLKAAIPVEAPAPPTQLGAA